MSVIDRRYTKQTLLRSATVTSGETSLPIGRQDLAGTTNVGEQEVAVFSQERVIRAQQWDMKDARERSREEPSAACE